MDSVNCESEIGRGAEPDLPPTTIRLQLSSFVRRQHIELPSAGAAPKRLHHLPGTARSLLVLNLSRPSTILSRLDGAFVGRQSCTSKPPVPHRAPNMPRHRSNSTPSTTEPPQSLSQLADLASRSARNDFSPGYTLVQWSRFLRQLASE